MLPSHQRLMEDLQPLNSEWDTINAPAFLINDVGHWNRDKLTLLATLCVCETEEGKRGSGEEDRLGLKQLLRVCTL